jgi:hypothetical protein
MITIKAVSSVPFPAQIVDGVDVLLFGRRAESFSEAGIPNFETAKCAPHVEPHQVGACGFTTFAFILATYTR